MQVSMLHNLILHLGHCLLYNCGHFKFGDSVEHDPTLYSPTWFLCAPKLNQ